MKKWASVALTPIILSLCLGGCAGENIALSTSLPALPASPVWPALTDFHYQLQDEDLEALGQTAYDLLVISIDAAEGNPELITGLKHSPGGEKIVLCYLSIGQAEDYRAYWQTDWSDQPPEWLDAPDRAWPGDHWVRYQHPDWQAIIYGSADAMLDQIIALGFDGVYLDRVDAYWRYERAGHEAAAAEMVTFVTNISAYARRIDPAFVIFIQNAEELALTHPGLLAAVDGIGVEDLYYGNLRENRASPAAWTTEREEILKLWLAQGKIVLTIDYTDHAKQIADAYARSRANGFIPFAAGRMLADLRINEGFPPD